MSYTGKVVHELQARILAGELVALADPRFLPLLLRDRGGAWWAHGARICMDAVLTAYTVHLEAHEASLVVEAWGMALDPLLSRSQRWSALLGSLRREPDAAARARLVLDLVEQLQSHEPRPFSAIVALARQLRFALPSAPTEVDTALAVLERYAT